MELKFENQEVIDSDVYVAGVDWQGQAFTPEISHNLTKIILNLWRYGEPTGNFTVSLRDPEGDILASKNLSAMSIVEGTNYLDAEVYEFIFDGQIILENGDTYSFVMSCPAGDVSNCINVIYCYIDEYPRGTRLMSSDGGSSWAADPDSDLYFSEWGYSINVPLDYPGMVALLFPLLMLLIVFDVVVRKSKTDESVLIKQMMNFIAVLLLIVAVLLVVEMLVSVI